MKIRVEQLSKTEREALSEALYAAADMAKGKDATRGLLRGLLTESERIMLGRRILIARMLLAGESFGEIAQVLGVGQDTVIRVDRWLSQQIPGYEGVMPTRKGRRPVGPRKKHWSDFYRNPSLVGALALLKRKYPLHFILFPWPKGYELPEGWR